MHDYENEWIMIYEICFNWNSYFFAHLYSYFIFLFRYFNNLLFIVALASIVRAEIVSHCNNTTPGTYICPCSSFGDLRTGCTSCSRSSNTAITDECPCLHTDDPRSACETNPNGYLI